MCVWLLINNAVCSAGCVCICSVCVLRAKQQAMCLLLWLMKCQWFGLSSRDTGCEKHLLFTLRLLTSCSGSWLMQCVITPILMGTCLMSAHKPLISSQGMHLLRTREVRIYISDIFLAKPLIYSFSSVLNFKTGYLFLPYKYMFPWKNCTHLKYEIGLRNVSFHIQDRQCQVRQINIVCYNFFAA